MLFVQKVGSPHATNCLTGGGLITVISESLWEIGNKEYGTHSLPMSPIHFTFCDAISSCLKYVGRRVFLLLPLNTSSEISILSWLNYLHAFCGPLFFVVFVGSFKIKVRYNFYVNYMYFYFLFGSRCIPRTVRWAEGT